MKKRICKFLSLALALMLCFGLFGCGDSSSGEPQASSGTTEEETTEESKYPIKLVDNDYISFEITDYDDVWGEYSYTVENKTDSDLNFEVEKVTANDEYTVDTWIYSDMGAGTKASDTFMLDSEVMDKFEDGQEITLKFKYKLIDDDTFDTVKSSSFKMNIIK